MRKKARRICRYIAGPVILLNFGLTLGIAGAIENGADLSLAWVAVCAVGWTYLILCAAAREG